LIAENARLHEALVLVDARLQMLARSEGGTVLYAVIALRDLIKRLREPS
jgi:hypothetical protein